MAMPLRAGVTRSHTQARVVPRQPLRTYQGERLVRRMHRGEIAAPPRGRSYRARRATSAEMVARAVPLGKPADALCAREHGPRRPNVTSAIRPLASYPRIPSVLGA